MAHITQGTKKAILQSVKKLVKQHDASIKVTASVRDCCSLTVRLKSERLLNEQASYNSAKQTNTHEWWEKKRDQVLYFPDTLNQKTLDLYKQIEKIIYTVGGYYNNSDAMTDCFDTAFYYDCVAA